ncbi:MAG: hypothetical protein HY280_07415 [Nitrospinae bacterium]|nr:hypothetical protein [Nitrospinota bacterium]
MKNARKIIAPRLQGTLGLKLDEKRLYSLERFYPGNANLLALSAAKKFATGKFQRVVVITGRAKCGKSHLLKGIFHTWPSGSDGQNAFFFNPKNRTNTPEQLLNQAVEIGGGPVLFCIDNLDQQHENEKEWYDAVFTLFNKLADSGGFLAVALRHSPANSPEMPDYLSSRLLTGMVVSLQKPDAEETRLILVKMADDRAVSLTPRAQKFILERSGRSIGDLSTLMDRLESEIDPGGGRVGLQLLRRVIDWGES